MELLHAHLLRAGRHRHHLLGEHVERVAGHHRRLDRARAHARGNHGALEQVGAELGEDAPLAGIADAVPRAADALEPARHRLGRLDLEHEVDRAHVDSQLQRGRGDQAGKLARLEQLLDHRALLARQRTVVSARQLLLGQLIEPQGQALGHAAVVDEHDGRAVLAHQSQDLGVDGGPDRSPRGLPAGARIERIGVRPSLLGLDHRLDRHVDAQVERLARAGVDDRGRAPRADQEARDLLERGLRGAQPDALGSLPVPAPELGQAFQRQGQVRPPLAAGHGMDLVDDHRLGGPEHVAGLRGEHQVQRLRSGDEDVRRSAQHGRALALRGVAGANGDAQVGSHAPQGSAQVALDVIGQGLERRYVDQADSRPGILRARLAAEAVERPQERGQRLPGPGWRRDEDVLAAGDGRPRLGLGGGGGLEGGGEPVPDAGTEGGQGHGSIEPSARPARGMQARPAPGPARTPRRSSPGSGDP